MTTDTRIERKVEAALREAGAREDSARLLRGIVALVREEVRLERERCMEICRARAELWTNTPGARSSLGPARDEARARSNEATAIADLIASDARYHTGSP